MSPNFIIESGLDAFGHAFKQVDLFQCEIIMFGFVTSCEVRKYGTDIHGTFGFEKFQQLRNILFVETGTIHAGIQLDVYGKRLIPCLLRAWLKSSRMSKA